MRNKIDLNLPPEDLFLNPWSDPGIKLLLEPEYIWKHLPFAQIEGFSVSAYPEIDRKIRSFVQTTQQKKKFKQAIEYNSVPAVLQNASFRKSHVMVEDKLMLSGASGTRLINRYLAESDSGAALDRYFENCQSENETREIPIYSWVLGKKTAFAVECRNTFNYFHFITESLAQLTVLDGLEFQGDIFFHFPNAEEKQRPFAVEFVEALFPEFAERVYFERAPKDYERVLTAYDLIGGHYQAPVSERGEIGREAPKGSDAINNIASRNVLAMNAVNTTLIALRERALAAIAEFDFGYLPKRFFVGRDTRKSRRRHMSGEDLLFDHLKLFGFEYVVFESLNPLEQIALMAGAEMMISYHGAGFTNMLFANPETCVIEIGTLQTAQFRWGDFWPLAHASQCRYISFFGDFSQENPTLEPNFATDGIVPVALSEQAIARIMGFVVTMLGQFPNLPSANILTHVVNAVTQSGSPERALILLDMHDGMVVQDCELCLLKANCHKALGEPKSELLALDQAYKADPTRWQTLVRMIWCANACERPQVIRWAVARLKVDFPQRHDAFVSNHEWVRYVA